MKRFLATILLGLMAVPSIHAAGLTWQTPVQAPALTFKDDKGSELLLEHYRGRPVLLNLWATWCAPCVEEMPSLQRLQRRMGNKLTVVPLSFDSGPNTVAQMFYRQNLTAFPILIGDQYDVSVRLGATSLPMTYLIDTQGKIHAVAMGALDWMDPLLVNRLDEWLAKQPAPSGTDGLPISDVTF